MHKSIFPALVVAATVSLSFAQDPNLHIYLAYGQSNMSGQADVTAADRHIAVTNMALLKRILGRPTFLTAVMSLMVSVTICRST